MLKSLTIENFILFEKISVDFSKTFSVITGETGAGKSIVIDAIEIVTGGKASSDQIKTGEKQSYIEGVFDTNDTIKEILNHNGFDEIEDTIILSRTIQKASSKCRINGQLVSLNVFKEIGENLIDIIGQNDNQSLFRVDKHKKIIDSLGDDEHKKVLDNIKNINSKLTLVKKEYEELRKTTNENKRQLDFFKFQLDEIDDAELILNEDEELKNERELLIHAEDIINNLNKTYYELYDSDDEKSLCDRLNNLSNLLSASAEYDQEINQLYEQFESAIIQIQEIGRAAKNKADSISSNPERLSEVEDRLNIIIKLKSKYGKTIESIIAFSDELRTKVSQAENSEEKLGEIEKEIILLEKKYKEQSFLLTESRTKISKKIEPIIENELSELGMEKTKFKVNIITKSETFSDYGNDSIEFLISPNPGEPLRSLSKTASGGESSRITLALKMVLHKQTQVPTLIFDEIDTGISGKSALIVSQKLAKLSMFSQILCITHLPIVACMADSHFWIEKNVTNEKTIVTVSLLEHKERIEKLSQISGGESNKSSLKYSEEIFDNANLYKKNLLEKETNLVN